MIQTAILAREPNSLSKHFQEALFHQTQGHALFTIELLRDMQGRGELQEAGKRLGSLLGDQSPPWIGPL